ncbi:hypothetical protein TH61_07835 [Rufibacter sp. DG15C]|nr:hypothetical protein TH61_07835 [Rufibacter sp. DG15C]
MLFGLIVTGIYACLGFYKLFRKKNWTYRLLIFSGLLASFQLLLSIIKDGILAPIPSDTLYGPITYMVSYLLLRKMYVAIYRVEPTYNRCAWYDPEDKRRQNLLDIVVHVLPFLLSITVAVQLAILKSN